MENRELNNIGLEINMFPLLTSPRFYIRAFRHSDLPVLTRYRADEVVARYQSWSDYTYADAEELFKSMDYSTFGTLGNWYQLALEEKNSGQLVGDLAVHFIDKNNMEVGFTIAAEHQRQGIGYEALTTLLNYLFLTLGKQKVVAFVDVKNRASYQLLEKAGFNRTANLEADSSILAEWGDEYLYTKTHSMHSA